ncbi:MAG: DUF4031 domain-containing protein [Actinomycetota bacterium]|nr:DUF4031 domain-containing protein [Actinomycetota bacterium]
MTILVDSLRDYPDAGLPSDRWCHLASDQGFDELHAFARRLGVPERGFHRDHYDLPPRGRARALALGAVAVSTRELVERMAGPRGERVRRRSRARCGPGGSAG